MLNTFWIRVFLSANREIAFVLRVCTFGHGVWKRSSRRRRRLFSLFCFIPFPLLHSLNNKNSVVFNFILFLFYLHLLFYIFLFSCIHAMPFRRRVWSFKEMCLKWQQLLKTQSNSPKHITKLNDMHTQISVLGELMAKRASEWGNTIFTHAHTHTYALLFSILTFRKECVTVVSFLFSRIHSIISAFCVPWL